jgi:hypothetical protein
MNSKRVSIKKYRMSQNIDDFKMEFFTQIKKYRTEAFDRPSFISPRAIK